MFSSRVPDEEIARAAVRIASGFAEATCWSMRFVTSSVLREIADTVRLVTALAMDPAASRTSPMTR